MVELSPADAARLARDVYALTNLDTVRDAIRLLNSTYNNTFAFDTNNLLKGKTGGPGIIKCQTAFGFTLIGKGRFEDHIFLLFRGTRYLADWLTNGNTTVSRSACGQPVHDGFNQSFISMRPQLTEFMNALPKGKVPSVHCIGHSLGGALATLCADWVVKSYSIRPYLYTFGSPRAGLMGFADQCTSSVGKTNIYRVYRDADIVPMIPTWPFIHTPSRGQDYCLSSKGSILNIANHYII